MATVYLRGKRIQLNPSKSIGKGGEADIFDIGSGMALKLFKTSKHPDVRGFPQEVKAVNARLAEHQQKLPAFPKNLPSRVISPEELATNKQGDRIVGYTMRLLNGFDVLLKYSDRRFRQAGVDNDLVVKTFRDLRDTVEAVHKAKVVIGDFNDLNILVANGYACIIDADSFQFGNFQCRVFTEKFVDPLLCDPNATRPILYRSHNEKSDWYAFSVMLMQSLLFVGPYGGIHRPKNKANRVNHATRPLKRLTVFDKDVKYPKPAKHFSMLPDDLLEYFHKTFKEDYRGQLPPVLLSNIRWTVCTNCGTTHGRRTCPSCSYHAARVKETVRGNVTCTKVFETGGIVVFATIQNNKLKFIYYNNGDFRREDNSLIIKGALRPDMRFRIKGKTTLIGDRSQVISFNIGEKPTRITVDTFGSLPLFDTNSSKVYWARDGQIFRGDDIGPKYIGDTLKDQTLFWVGPRFGIGFYRAGNFHVGFTFDIRAGGVNDSLRLPQMRGQLVDAVCYFAGSWAWLLVSVSEGGKIINRCTVYKFDGTVKCSAEAVDGDGTWLGTIRGKCAAANFLLCSTDEGIMRVEPDGTNLSVAKEFPDTEPFVDSGCHLHPSKQGLYVISRREIHLLKIR